MFRAAFDGTLFDPAGNAVAPISGTERGARIVAEIPWVESSVQAISHAMFA